MGDAAGRRVVRLTYSVDLDAPLAAVWRATTDLRVVSHISWPWVVIRPGRNGARQRLGGNATVRADYWIFGIIPTGTWTLRVRQWQPPDCWSEEITCLPYRHWQHTHRYEPSGLGTRYTDIIELEPRPWLPLSVLFIRLLWRTRQARLRRFFRRPGSSSFSVQRSKS